MVNFRASEVSVAADRESHVFTIKNFVGSNYASANEAALEFLTAGTRLAWQSKPTGTLKRLK